MFHINKLMAFASSSSDTSKASKILSRRKDQKNATEINGFEEVLIKTEPVDVDEGKHTNNCDFSYKITELSNVKTETKQEDVNISEEGLQSTVKEECMSDESNKEMSPEDTEPEDQMESSEGSEVTELRWRRRDLRRTTTCGSVNIYNTRESCKHTANVFQCCGRPENSTIVSLQTGASSGDLRLQQNQPTKWHTENVLQGEKIKLETLTKEKETFETKKYKENTKNPVTTGISARTSSLALKIKSLNNIFICDICNRPFHQKPALAKHIQNHPTKLHNCTYCSYKTYISTTLSRHINSKHTNSISFNCSYCNYITYNLNTLNRHINSKHTKSSRFNCPYCSYITCTKSTLKQHVNSSHTKRTSFNCSYCSFVTYDKRSLRQHLNSKHTKSKSFQCANCSYITYDKSALKKHINAKHSKDTVYNCSYCSFKTYNNTSLKLHTNSKHTKSTAFDCSYCSFKTYLKNVLKQHVNGKHTKTISYDCTYCSYKTYYKLTLSKHIKAKHS